MGGVDRVDRFIYLVKDRRKEYSEGACLLEILSTFDRSSHELLRHKGFYLYLVISSSILGIERSCSTAGEAKIFFFERVYDDLSKRGKEEGVRNRGSTRTFKRIG